MFETGSCFLVCHTALERDSGIFRVYLREVILGNGSNVVLWLDENLQKRNLLIHHKWIQIANKEK